MKRRLAIWWCGLMGHRPIVRWSQPREIHCIHCPAQHRQGRWR